jgi:hypothetical protein
VLDGGRALDFFLQGLREPVRVEREVSDQPFQPAVFFFELPEPPQLAHAQMGLRLFPGVDCGVTHPKLPAEVTDGGAGLRLPDGKHNLLLRKL